MSEHKDYFGEKLRLLERAREDAYFRQLDQKLLEQMRQTERTEVEAVAQVLLPSVLVPVDFSPYATEALRYAAGIAERFASSLIVLHVIPHETTSQAVSQRLGLPHVLAPGSASAQAETDMPPDVTEEVVIDLREQAYAALQAFLPARLTTRPVELRVVVGQPFERIIETAVREQVGLIVLGTHGRTGLAHMIMGSVAERVVRLAPCPVLTVKMPSAEEKNWLQGLYEKLLAT